MKQLDAARSSQKKNGISRGRRAGGIQTSNILLCYTESLEETQKREISDSWRRLIPTSWEKQLRQSTAASIDSAVVDPEPFHCPCDFYGFASNAHVYF